MLIQFKTKTQLTTPLLECTAYSMQDRFGRAKKVGNRGLSGNPAQVNSPMPC